MIENKDNLNNKLNNIPQDSIQKSSLNHSAYQFQTNQNGVYDQLNQYLNDQDLQQKTVAEAREILGESAQSLEDGQIYEMVTEMQYLVDTWLEEYEQKVFEGKTLKELLQSDL